jgi:hypothetical protein
MEQLNLNHISTGEPTYWPSDWKKLPDLLDFCVTKGIPHNSALFDLSSDHSHVLITLTPSVLNQAPPPRLFDSKTNWDYFHHLISMNLTLHVPLKTDSQIEDAVKYLKDIIQWAGWNATLETTYTLLSYTCPIFIKQKLAEKTRLQKEWQHTRTPTSKPLLIRAMQDLKQLLHHHKNASIQTFLHGLTPMASTDYSLWSISLLQSHTDISDQ